MSAAVETQNLFFNAPTFAVAGASKDQSKYGNRLLRWYQTRNQTVIPINPRETEIEGLTPVKSLSELPDPTHTSISVVTPPKVTLGLLEQAKELNIPALWIQPGAEDENVIKYVNDNGLADKVIYGGACVLVLGDDALQRVGKKSNL